MSTPIDRNAKGFYVYYSYVDYTLFNLPILYMSDQRKVIECK